MFCSMVICGEVPAIGSWKTRPMKRARWKSCSRVTSWPSIRTLPASGRSLPDTMFSSVDLPAPLLPITVMKSPAARSREIPSSATRSFTVPAKKVFLMFSIFSMC